MLNSYALRSFEEKNESAAAPHSHGKWRAMLHNERISDFVSLSKYAVAFFGRRFLLSLDSSRFNRLISHPAAEPQQPDILVQGSANASRLQSSVKLPLCILYPLHQIQGMRAYKSGDHSALCGSKLSYEIVSNGLG
jgi:hypothetical protein